jgi:hypothetical protein
VRPADWPPARAQPRQLKPQLLRRLDLVPAVGLRQPQLKRVDIGSCTLYRLVQRAVRLRFRPRTIGLAARVFENRDQ